MSDEKTKSSKRSLPSQQEIEKMVSEAFPSASSMCPLLCNELQNAVEAVEEAPTPQAKARALVRLHAIAAQVKALHCRCTPQ